MSEALAWPDPGESRTRRTRRWHGSVALAMVLIVGGILLRNPGVVLAATVGVGVAGYARIVDPPEPNVRLSRSVEGSENGSAVTLTVTNQGDGYLADLWVVDGVPEHASVVEGSPACRTALSPGQSTTLRYTVETGRGAVGFRPALVRTRDSAGVTEHATRIEATGDDAVTRAPVFDPIRQSPLAVPSASDTGRRTVDQAESGIVFQVLREHRRGDPMSRIDWAHWAKTGDPATVEYRPERAASVVLVIDTRPAARLAPDPDAPTAVQRSLSAAARLFATFDDAGDRVGVATLDDDRRWLPPGRGRSHRARAHALLTDDAIRSGREESFDPRTTAEWLTERLSSAAQVVVLTPLCDDGMASFLARVDALGVPTTVYSPDPTTGDTPGRRLATLERRRRIDRLRRTDVTVYDWAANTGLERTLLRRQQA